MVQSASSSYSSGSSLRRFAQFLFVSLLVSAVLYAVAPYDDGQSIESISSNPVVTLRSSSSSSSSSDLSNSNNNNNNNDDDEDGGESEAAPQPSEGDDEAEEDVVDREVPTIETDETAKRTIPSPNHDQEEHAPTNDDDDEIPAALKEEEETPSAEARAESDAEDDTPRVTPEKSEITAIPESTSVKQQQRRRVVCVASTNLRTASIFSTRIFERHGSAFDYQVKEKCVANELSASQPVVKMFYQKFLAERPPAHMELIRKSTDFVFVMGDEYCKMPVGFPDVHGRQFFSSSYIRGGGRGCCCSTARAGSGRGRGGGEVDHCDRDDDDVPNGLPSARTAI